MIQNCLRKKYFKDNTLNSITGKISTGRREIFIDILKEYNIQKFTDLSIKCIIEKHEILDKLQEAEKSLIFKQYYEDESQLEDVKFDIKYYEYEDDIDRQYKTYNILLFGIQGEGKKSLVNTLCSYLQGCKNEENKFIYRRESKLRYEIYEQNQLIAIHSDPLKKIFKIHNLQNSQTNDILEKLQTTHEIYVIGFVGSQQQGSLSQEQYIKLKDVCSYLPKQARDRIFHFITFSDMVEMAPGYYQEEFKFLENQSYQIQNEAIGSNRKGLILNIQFERTIKNIYKFIEKISDYEPLNIEKQIEEICNYRKKLKEKQNKYCETKQVIQQVNVNIKKLEFQINKEQIVKESNSNYTYYEAASKYNQEKLPIGKQATVCHSCNSTCCMSCEATNLNECSQFRVQKCVKCQCSLEKHRLVDYKIVVQIIQLVKEITDMKIQFEIAQQKIYELQVDLENLTLELLKLLTNQETLEKDIDEVKVYLNENVIIGA